MSNKIDYNSNDNDIDSNNDEDQEVLLTDINVEKPLPPWRKPSCGGSLIHGTSECMVNEDTGIRYCKCVKKTKNFNFELCYHFAQALFESGCHLTRNEIEWQKFANNLFSKKPFSLYKVTTVGSLKERLRCIISEITSRLIFEGNNNNRQDVIQYSTYDILVLKIIKDIDNKEKQKLNKSIHHESYNNVKKRPYNHDDDDDDIEDDEYGNENDYNTITNLSNSQVLLSLTKYQTNKYVKLNHNYSNPGTDSHNKDSEYHQLVLEKELEIEKLKWQLQQQEIEYLKERNDILNNQYNQIINIQKEVLLKLNDNELKSNNRFDLIDKKHDVIENNQIKQFNELYSFINNLSTSLNNNNNSSSRY